MEKKKEVPLLILQMKMNTMIVFIFTLLFLSTPSSSSSVQSDPPTVCIMGSGIGGSSVAHFLRQYSDQSHPPNPNLRTPRPRRRQDGYCLPRRRHLRSRSCHAPPQELPRR
ncbi:hypothetical protein CsSME_00019946 [Camellia sinensis var. sinensis]